jgi:hypothetical protein
VSEEEQNNILKQFEKKETEYMRLQRHKMSVDDFDLLTMIGKGAFGEVNPFKCIPLFIMFLYLFFSPCCKLSFRSGSAERRPQGMFMQ